MKQRSDIKNIIEIIQIFLSIFFAALLFCAGVVLGFESKTAAAGITFTAAICCLIFSYLSRFKRFKGLGVEAELWDQTKDEAALLVKTLRSLATVVSEQLVVLSARTGRWDAAMSAREMFELTEKLNGILANIDVPYSERESTKAEYYRYAAIDMARPIIDMINRAIHNKEIGQVKVVNSFGSPVHDQKGHAEATRRLQQIRGQKIDLECVVATAPNAELISELERKIDSADCLRPDERSALRDSIAEDLEDLRELVFERRLRRPERWFAKGG